MEIIVLDPGHGGLDPGATAGPFMEKAFNWQIANIVKDCLTTYDCQVYIIQPSTEFHSTAKDEEEKNGICIMSMESIRQVLY